MGRTTEPPRVRDPRSRDRRYFATGAAVAVPLTVVAVTVFGAGSPDHHEPVTSDPRVFVIPDASIKTLPTKRTQVLIAEGSWDEVEDGDYLTDEFGSHTKEGFLLKVRAKYEENDETRFATRGASLYEAVPYGSLVANPFEFEPEPDLAATTPAPLEEEAPERVPALANAAFHEDAGLFHELFGEHIPHFHCDEPAEEMNLTPSFTPSFEPHLNLTWNERQRLRRPIATAAAGILGELRAAVSGSMDGTFHCELTPELKLHLFKAVAPAGPVPVPIKVYVTVAPTMEGTIGSKVEGSLEVGLAGDASIEYAGGDGLRARGTLVPKLAFKPPKFESGANGRVGLKPEIVIAAGWRAPWLGELVASAGLALPSTATLRYDAAAGEQRPKVCFNVGMKGTLKLNLPKPLKRFSPKRSAKEELLEKCGRLGAKEEREEEEAGEAEPPAAEAG